MKIFRLLSYLLVCAIIVVVIGCASSGKKHFKNLYVAPGLDTLTVIKATEVADNNFVSYDREREAERLAKLGKHKMNKVDEFWSYLEQRVNKKNLLSKSEREQFSREYSLGAQALARWKDLSKNGTDKNAALLARDFCVQAQNHLEQAVRINPYDKNVRVLLAVTYYNLQHLFGMEKNSQKAVEILERLTRIEKGEHELFRLLGENYQVLGEHENALTNFKKALTVLLKTSFESPPDSATLFNYAYAQGDAYARLYDAVNAGKAFQTALTFACSAQEKDDVRNYIAWINWDNGNIRASEQWDEIRAMEAAKDYAKMASKCVNLLPALRTKQAKLSVAHKLAVIEFEFLNKKAPAVERMRQVYQSLSPAELNKSSSEIKPFLDSYGAMLYRLGMDAMSNQDKKLALAYFTKATSFDWEQVAKAYIEMVTLLWNNPEKAIIYGKKALASYDGLSAKESCDLLSLMVRAHKSAGLFDEARGYFNKWKQCSKE